MKVVVGRTSFLPTLKNENTNSNQVIVCGNPRTFALKQPKAASSRWTHAKVTTHNLATTNLTVTANFHSTGLAITLK